MLYDEIAENIKQTSPQIHAILDIKTVDVIEILKKEDIGFFIAPKTDSSMSFFVAFKMLRNREDSWVWWCPTENQVNVFSNDLRETYQNVDRFNLTHRTRRQKNE